MLAFILALAALVALASRHATLIHVLVLLEALTLAVLTLLILSAGSTLQAAYGSTALVVLTMGGCEAAVLLSTALAFKWARGLAELRPTSSD